MARPSYGFPFCDGATLDRSFLHKFDRISNPWNRGLEHARRFWLYWHRFFARHQMAIIGANYKAVTLHTVDNYCG